MGLDVHFKVDIATKVFEGITRFDFGDNFIINKQHRLVLERTETKFLDPKRHNVTYLSTIILTSDRYHI